MSNKSDFYRNIDPQLNSLLSGVEDAVANMSQFSAFLNMHLSDINWVGFYLSQPDGSLLLGPFQGNVACVEIPLGKGVCGAAAKTGEIQIVEDVDQFEGHIACDARSRSEVVIPLLSEGRTIGVLDIDSPSLARFDQDDAEGLSQLVATLMEKTRF